MTGYGRAKNQFENKIIRVEMKSLNSKQLDLSFKLPYIYQKRENLLRNLLSPLLERGKIDVFVTLETSDEQQEFRFNEKFIQFQFKELRKLINSMSISASDEVLLQSILRIPEVYKENDSEINAVEWNAVERTAKEAAISLIDSRLFEGNAIAVDILKHIKEIQILFKQIEPFEDTRIDKIKQRIKLNFNEFLPETIIDNNRFEQEMIYYLEKIDFTEEKVRLLKHCTYFLDTATELDPVGKKLGFIAQEIGREINTIGAKANDSDIQKIVVQMKDEIEKIKEQLMNVL